VKKQKLTFTRFAAFTHVSNLMRGYISATSSILHRFGTKQTILPTEVSQKLKIERQKSDKSTISAL
jgi:hypothetical protein